MKARKEKVVTLEEAAKLVPDGSSISIGGVHSHNAPMALIRQLLKRGVKDLTLMPLNASGIQVDILIGAGRIKRIYNSYTGLDYIGMAPAFRRFAEEGRIDVKECEEMFVLRGLKAAAMGLPFFPLPKGLGVHDCVNFNHLYKRVVDPYTGDSVVVVPPLQPDVGIIHATQADQYGNVRCRGNISEVLVAEASKRVIATVEEIISPEETMSNPERTSIPGFLVDAVVHAPYGAHPGECFGRYHCDEEHLKRYAQAAGTASAFDDYLTEYVSSPRDHAAYIEKIGLTKLQSLSYQGKW